MWTSTNYFLVNLSFTDLLMTIFNGVFNFIYMRDNDWPFGSVYCTVNNFVAYYTVIASVLTLTAITLDRYRVFKISMFKYWVRPCEKIGQNNQWFKPVV